MSVRAEQTFFADPALDRAVAMLMTLAAELYVTKDRVRSLETVLVQRGVLEAGDVENYEPSPQDRLSIDAERDAFVHSLLAHIKGKQVSRGVA